MLLFLACIQSVFVCLSLVANHCEIVTGHLFPIHQFITAQSPHLNNGIWITVGWVCVCMHEELCCAAGGYNKCFLHNVSARAFSPTCGVLRASINLVHEYD